MRQLTIWILQYRIRLAEKKIKVYLIDCMPMAYAYQNMVKNYKDTIMYLKAEK